MSTAKNDFRGIMEVDEYMILSVEAPAYEKAATPFPLYDGTPFLELNRHKADYVHYLLFCDDKPRFALAGGVRDHMLKLPVSASFCAFSRIGNDRIEHDHDACSTLISGARTQRSRQIVFSLPPAFLQRSVHNAEKGLEDRPGHVLGQSRSLRTAASGQFLGLEAV